MTYVLGLGNVLMGDDGAGPAVVRAFDAQYIAGSDVSVVDVGTPGLDLTPWCVDADRVILVDTVKSDRPPGTLRLYNKADLLRRAPTPRVSPHDPGVKETLLALEFAGRAPRDVVLIGIVPATTAMNLELSAPVRAAIEPAVKAVVAALERFGIDVQRRPGPASQQAWWVESRRSTTC